MNEFTHYGHHPSRKDLDNCSACALLYAETEPNYAAWPLAFLQNGRQIPTKYYAVLKKELSRKDNDRYVENLKQKLAISGFNVEVDNG